MDPYTPKVSRAGSMKNKLTLSAKQYSKISQTIASVRQSRFTGGEAGELALREDDERPSFISEKSFISAPLNSRVPSTSSATVHVTVNGKGKGKAKAPSLDKVPVDVQEALILEDLLFVLTGIEGTYITYPLDFSPEDENPLHGMRFVTTNTLDPSLRDLVERILPLATYYTSITAFMEERSHHNYGLVNHALCAAMRDMLKDYHTLLSQLEHAFSTSPSFSLQKLWFYVHPTLHTLSLLASLVSEISTVDEQPESSESGSQSEAESEMDEEERARNEALGLGSAKLKAIISDALKDGSPDGSSSANAGPAIGGEVLAILHSRKQQLSGDPSALALYSNLLRASGRPYAAMLESWIWYGRLGGMKGDVDGGSGDVYGEFCVREARGVDKGILEGDYTDEYWERRFSLRDGSSSSSARHKAGVPAPRSQGGRLPGGACIPPFLEPWKHKILLSGKYLNVLQECGTSVQGGQESLASVDDEGLDGEKFYKSIESAYSFANSALVHVLLHDQRLLSCLRFLRRLFFSAEGDWVGGFLATDAAQNELRRAAWGTSGGANARVGRLQGLVEVALAASGVGGASKESGGRSYEEGVHLEMAKTGLYEWLLKIVNVNGVMGNVGSGLGGDEEGAQEEKEKDKKQLLAIDALVLDYRVPFPLSLVISRKTVVRYQFLFRFLLHLRHVEQVLCSMWVDQKAKVWRAILPPVKQASSATAPKGHSRPPSRATEEVQAEDPAQVPELERWRRRIFVLRAKMLAFVQQILAFVTFEVLEPNWRKLEAKLGALAEGVGADTLKNGTGDRRGRQGTVEELLRDHVDFLDTCLKESMLTSAKLLKSFSRIIVTCSTFALYSSNFTKSADQVLSQLEACKGDYSSIQMEKRWDFLKKFETNFNHWFKIHLDYVQYYASSENVALLPLVVRLNSVKSV